MHARVMMSNFIQSFINQMIYFLKSFQNILSKKLIKQGFMCRETVLSPKLLLFRVEDFPRGSSFRHFQGNDRSGCRPFTTSINVLV